jgi:ABC-type transport system substrate-binding protein
VFLHHQFDLTVIDHAEPYDYDIYAKKDYYFGYQSPAYDALMAQLKASTDPLERHRLLGEIQRRLAEDAANAFLYQAPILGVQDKRITGIWVNSPTQARLSGGAV